MWSGSSWGTTDDAHARSRKVTAHARSRKVTVSDIVLDPYDYDFHEDPYPYYKRLRDEAPLYRNEALSFWALSRFRDVLAASHDWETYSSREGTSVERFDPDKGGKLSTYAAWWIKQSIKRALANQSKTIRLPVHMVDKIAKMRRIAAMLTEALGREPTDEELADEIGVPRRKLAMLRQASHRPTSLDAPINEGEATEYGEIISDERAVNPLDMLSDKNLHGELDGLLSVLDERERRIIDERFGLNGRKALTLEEVGREFGVTRERIRQLQNSALTKMRRALRKKEKPIPKPLASGLAGA